MVVTVLDPKRTFPSLQSMPTRRLPVETNIKPLANAQPVGLLPRSKIGSGDQVGRQEKLRQK